MLLGSQDRHSEAITCTLQALNLAETFAAEPGMEFAMLVSLNNVAWQYACAGKLDEARSYARQALGHFRQAGDSGLIASALDTLGFVQHRLGQHAEAVGCFRESLDLFASLSSLYKFADTAEHLAEAYQALGDPAKARAALRDALAVLDELQHPRATEIRGKLLDPGLTCAPGDHQPEDPSCRIGPGTSRRLPALGLRYDIGVTQVRLFCAEPSGGKWVVHVVHVVPTRALQAAPVTTLTPGLGARFGVDGTSDV
jgi:tetratricopeptide (TPR) repeat protein